MSNTYAAFENKERTNETINKINSVIFVANEIIERLNQYVAYRVNKLSE